MSKGKTTEDLRAILFDAIDSVKTGKMSVQEGREVGNLAGRIIETADLELRWSLAVSKLDKDDQKVTPGAVPLTKMIVPKLGDDNGSDSG